MEFIEKGIPLWKITIWDKRFNNVDNEWQPKTIKYNYLLSDELNSIKSEYGDVRILYTGKEVGYTTEELAGKNLSEGEIVSIPWGGIPSVKYYKGKFVTGDNRIATSSDVNRLTNKYLYYFLRGNIHEVASYYRGASLKHPNMKDILKMKISFPSIDIQEKICTQLDILESIIALRQKELLELDRLIRARFVESFGEIEEICNVDYYIKELIAGKSLAGEVECKNKVLKTGAVSFDYFDKNQTKNLPLDYEPKKEHLVCKGDIIISRMNTAELTGATAYVWDISENVYIPDRLWKAVIREGVNSIFVWNMLIQTSTKEQILKKCSGTSGSMKNISKAGMLGIKVKKVDNVLQDKFGTFVEEVYKSKVKVQRALDEAQLLFDSLMQKYFG